jgi:hypothetical protein
MDILMLFTRIHPSSQTSQTLKLELDKMLREWKPKGFDPMGIEIDPVRVCCSLVAMS